MKLKLLSLLEFFLLITLFLTSCSSSTGDTILQSEVCDMNTGSICTAEEAGGDRIILNNGLAKPLIGLGTWQGKHNEVEIAVYDALRAGYRHIDTAWIYKNQHEIGKALNRAIRDGIVKREDVWITSKLWNDFHAAHQVEPHLRDNLQQLGLEYLDEFLMHWPVTDIEGPILTPSIKETWQAMEALVEKGLVKTIGVSNFSLKKIHEMKKYAEIFPAINQVELHPLLRQDELVEGCRKLGVQLTAYSPLGSPGSSTGRFEHNGKAVLENDVVLRIAQETGKTPGQVLIKWAVQRGTIVIPKSVTPSRIIENFAMNDWRLNDEQFEELSSLPEQERMLRGDIFLNSNGPYRTLHDLWDEY